MDLKLILKEVATELNKQVCKTHGSNTKSKFEAIGESINDNDMYCCQEHKGRLKKLCSKLIHDKIMTRANEDIKNILKNF